MDGANYPQECLARNQIVIVFADFLLAFAILRAVITDDVGQGPVTVNILHRIGFVLDAVGQPLRNAVHCTIFAAGQGNSLIAQALTCHKSRTTLDQKEGIARP